MLAIAGTDTVLEAGFALLATDDPTHQPWPYVVACFAIVAIVVIGYAIWVIRRGRELSEQVDESDRRFL